MKNEVRDKIMHCLFLEEEQEEIETKMDFLWESIESDMANWFEQLTTGKPKKYEKYFKKSFTIFPAEGRSDLEDLIVGAIISMYASGESYIALPPNPAVIKTLSSALEKDFDIIFQLASLDATEIVLYTKDKNSEGRDNIPLYCKDKWIIYSLKEKEK